MSEYAVSPEQPVALPPEVTDAAGQAAAGAAPASVDVAALLARLQAVEAQANAAQQAAAEAAKAAEPKPATLSEVLVNVADAASRHAFQIIAEHLGL